MMAPMGDDAELALAEELGVAELPPEERKRVLAAFGEVALKAATVAILEKLPKAAREEFASLAEKGDAAALQTFLDREVPDHEKIAGAAIALEAARLKESVTV